MSAAPQTTVVLVDETSQHTAAGAYKGMHALVPVLIGLSVPILLFTLFDPRALSSARLVLHFVMMGIALIAAVLFVLSIVNPGTVVQATFDPEKRHVVLVRSGAFANSELWIPFERVAAVRIETEYDDDGYQSRVPVLSLASRKRIVLPGSVSEAEVAEIRALMARR